MRASSFPSRLGTATTPPWPGGRTSARMWICRPSSSEAQGRQLAGMVVVAGDDDAGDALGDQPGEEVVDELLGLGRRSRRVEHVAREEDGVDLARGRDPVDLVERRRELVHAGAAAQRLPDVPVGGVQEAQVSPGR